MTDDELDRALFSLPLEELPAGLHDRIIAATVARGPAVAASGVWEMAIVVLLVAIAGIVATTFVVSMPDAGVQVQSAFVTALHALGLFTPATYAWLAVGLSSVWAISSLPLMPQPVRHVYNG